MIIIQSILCLTMIVLMTAKIISIEFLGQCKVSFLKNSFRNITKELHRKERHKSKKFMSCGSLYKLKTNKEDQLTAKSLLFWTNRQYKLKTTLKGSFNDLETWSR